MLRNKKALVIGASGFLGSHLVRELLNKDYSVKILVRQSSNINILQGLDYEKSIGDVLNIDSLVRAMEGCDYVFHSAVNTKAWLFDSKPLYETNVTGVKNSVEAAKLTGIKKFILTSSLVTIGQNKDGAATEDIHPDEKDLFTDYIKTRYIAEQFILDEYRNNNFPAIAGCVSNTYGPYDVQPTPHGNLIKQLALGKIPFYFNSKSECVGVDEAAKALILCAEKGRPGERYIISERYISNKDLYTIAANHAGVRVPVIKLPKFLLYIFVLLNEILCRITGTETQLTRNSVKLLYKTWPMSNRKAVEELGWNPKPIKESIKNAVDFYLGRY